MDESKVIITCNVTPSDDRGIGCCVLNKRGMSRCMRKGLSDLWRCRNDCKCESGEFESAAETHKRCVASHEDAVADESCQN